MSYGPHKTYNSIKFLLKQLLYCLWQIKSCEEPILSQAI